MKTNTLEKCFFKGEYIQLRNGNNQPQRKKKVPKCLWHWMYEIKTLKKHKLNHKLCEPQLSPSNAEDTVTTAYKAYVQGFVDLHFINANHIRYVGRYTHFSSLYCNN